MDILVSHLNHRMALQLPAEFPMGLVFVVGHIERFLKRGGNGESVSFYLSEGGHRIRCRLSSRHADGVELNQDDLIRAGGHLAFDTAYADYFLLARDIEILGEYKPSRTALSEIIPDAWERTQVEMVQPEQMPVWVKNIAPPELRANWQRLGIAFEGNDEESPIVQPELLVTPRGDLSYPAHEPALAQLSDELIEFLSDAMDSDEEVEVTAELLSTAELTGRSTEQEARYSNRKLATRPMRPAETRVGLTSQAQVQDDGSVEWTPESSRIGERTNSDAVPWYLVLAVLILFVGFSAVIIYTLLLQLA